MRDTSAAAIASQSGSFESPPLHAVSVPSATEASAVSALLQRIMGSLNTLSSPRPGPGSVHVPRRSVARLPGH